MSLIADGMPFAIEMLVDAHSAKAKIIEEPVAHRLRRGVSKLRPLRDGMRILKDPMSGFFIIRKECINHVKLSAHGFKILIEILINGKFNSIIEVPYIFKPRQEGKSKLDIKEFLNYMFMLLMVMKSRT